MCVQTSKSLTDDIPGDKLDCQSKEYLRIPNCRGQSYDNMAQILVEKFKEFKHE